MEADCVKFGKVTNNKCDTGLRYFIQINSKEFTPRYKQMSQCKVFIQAKQLQHTLNALRNRYLRDDTDYKIIVLPNDMIFHLKPKDTIEKIICPYTSLGKCFVIVYCFILNLLLIILFLQLIVLQLHLFNLIYPNGNV